MLSSLRPYKYWIEDGKYIFDTPSGARYVAYFLDLSFISDNLFTFNFDREVEGTRKIIDSQVFDTICTILGRFFQSHVVSMLLVCDSQGGREEARKRLFDSWFSRLAPKNLMKIDRSGYAEEYRLFVSIIVWQDNPNKDKMIAILDEYCSSMLDY